MGIKEMDASLPPLVISQIPQAPLPSHSMLSRLAVFLTNFLTSLDSGMTLLGRVGLKASPGAVDRLGDPIVEREDMLLIDAREP